ncbi:MAG: sugar phosphate isomerase/epimerase family protein [Bryobacteraceae bacterium]
MGEKVTRREVLAAGAALAAPGRQADIKVGLYSITYLGLWYRGEALTLEQLVERARSFGYQGIEIDGKRAHGCPLWWTRERCQRLRQYAADRGVAICGVAANNGFSSPIPEHREAQLAWVREMIRMTADFGAPVLRVFLAWPGATKAPEGGGRYDVAQRLWDAAHEGVPEEQAWEWCRQCLIEAARYAGEHGITLALQNHKPLINNYRQMLEMIREVGSPHLKACLDAPILEDKDPAYVRRAVLDTGGLQVQSHFGGEYERPDPDGPIRRAALRRLPDGRYERLGYEARDYYPGFVRALTEIGYRGWINYELCHPLPVINGRTVGLEFVDRSVRLAAEYMREVIARARGGA